jgi:hypothetical protein
VYTNYQDYKRFLRLDFLGRCAYCRITERRWGSDRNFVVEHFRPKGRTEFERLRCVYSNLYYACNRCNDFKGTTWPTKGLRARGYYFADPCSCDVYREHVKITKGGRLKALTACGEYSRDHLRLDRPLLVIWRKERSDLTRDIAKAETAIKILEKRIKPILDESTKREFQLLIDAHRELSDRLARDH